MASVPELEKQFHDSEEAAAAGMKKRERIGEIKESKPEVVKELRTLSESLQRLVDTNPRTLTKEAAAEFINRLANMRSEDLATIVGYLDKVTRKITDFLAEWSGELDKQAKHREREKETLDQLDRVLKNYE